MRLRYFGSSQNRIRSAVQSSQLSPALRLRIAPLRLHRRIDVVGGVRVDVEPHDPAGKGHDDAVGQARIGKLFPMLTAIVAAVDRDRRRPGIDPPRVFWMDQDRPDIRIGIGQRQALEFAAAVGAAVEPLGAADKNRVGVARRHGDRVDLGVFREPAAQFLPFIGADFLTKDAAQPAAMRDAHCARHAGVNMRCTRHRFLLSFGEIRNQPQAMA